MSNDFCDLCISGGTFRIRRLRSSIHACVSNVFLPCRWSNKGGTSATRSSQNLGRRTLRACSWDLVPTRWRLLLAARQHCKCSLFPSLSQYNIRKSNIHREELSVVIVDKLWIEFHLTKTLALSKVDFFPSVSGTKCPTGCISGRRRHAA